MICSLVPSICKSTLLLIAYYKLSMENFPTVYKLIDWTGTGAGQVMNFSFTKNLKIPDLISVRPYILANRTKTFPYTES